VSGEAARLVWHGTSLRSWRRLFTILGGGMAVTVWVTLTSYHGNPVDAWDFWVDPARPYATEDIHQYLYSPAFAQAIAPFQQAGFDGFVALLRAAELACAFFLAAPALVVGLFLPPVAAELNAANINLIIVTAIVLGFRWPALWAFVLLTKPTMGIGLLWFALRREWRALAIAIGATAGIAAVSFVINPAAWGDYLGTLARANPTPGWPFPWPIWVRLVVALPLVIWGARTGRPWGVGLGSVLAAPRLYFLSPVMLLGLVPLLPKSTFARRLRAGWESSGHVAPRGGASRPNPSPST
jgi:hypothetical protein